MKIVYYIRNIANHQIRLRRLPVVPVQHGYKYQESPDYSTLLGKIKRPPRFTQGALSILPVKPLP